MPDTPGSSPDGNCERDERNGQRCNGGRRRRVADPGVANSFVTVYDKRTEQQRLGCEKAGGRRDGDPSREFDDALGARDAHLFSELAQASC